VQHQAPGELPPPQQHTGDELGADARIGVVAPFQLGSGFAFDGSLRAGMSSPVRHEPEVGLPDGTVALSASVGLDLTLVLLLTIQEIPVGGPVIGASLGTLARVGPTTGVDVDGAAAVMPADTGMVVVEDRSHPWLAALDGAGVPRWQSTAADE
jgi:hypothetical protein